jgi:hypothetical protein
MRQENAPYERKYDKRDFHVRTKGFFGQQRENHDSQDALLGNETYCRFTT